MGKGLGLIPIWLSRKKSEIRQGCGLRYSSLFSLSLIPEDTYFKLWNDTATISTMTHKSVLNTDIGPDPGPIYNCLLDSSS